MGPEGMGSNPVQVPGWAGRGEGKGREGGKEERGRGDRRKGQKILFVP